MEEPLAILKRLCSHVTGITDERRLTEQYHISVSVLRSCITSGGGVSGSVEDAQSVGSRINKWLVRHDRLQEAVQFSNLLKNLNNSVVLKNKASVLTLLFLLGQESHNYTNTLKSTGNQGSVFSADVFTLPSFGPGRSVPSASSKVNRNVQSDEYVSNRPGFHLPTEHVKSDKVSQLSALFRGMNRQAPPIHQQPSRQSASLYRTPQLPQIEVTEEVLVREVLFVLQGIEGKIIRFDMTNDGYKIDTKVRISQPQKDLILKLSEVGWLYSQIVKFCESEQRTGTGLNKSISVGNIASGDSAYKLSQSVSHSALSQIASGGGLVSPVSPVSYPPVSSSPTLVNQSLVLALKDHLNEHCRLIAILEAQLSGSDSESSLTLRKLLLWTLEPRIKLQCMLHMVESAKGLKGGALLSALHKHLEHGSPINISVVQHALCRATAPIHSMLTSWLLSGSFMDPHQEFFIAANNNVKEHDLWHHKYSIRWSMLPSFISADDAHKILAAGKSLNFLRCVCKISALVEDHEAISAAIKVTTVESLFLPSHHSSLEVLIDSAYRAACGRVLQEVVDRQQLLQHLRALRRYLLLGQGDFIHTLLQVLREELCKPASKLYPHNLSSLLETAVSASNARYDQPDTLRRLDVKLLEVAQGDTGWDVFSLDYHVDGPIGTVLTSECMQQYLMLFNSLWRAKHMEYILSETWKQQAETSKLCRRLPEMRGVVHSVQLLLSEMIHMVHQLGYYMTFEVLEVSWHNLMTSLTEAHSLDQLIHAHTKFLQKIVKGALLDDNSRDVRTHLRSVYDLMLRLEEMQKRLHKTVTTELDMRNAKLEREKARTLAGEFATSIEEENEETERRYTFTAKTVPLLRSELKILTQTYQDMVQSLLLMLAAHNDDNLHQLRSRLDFNEHYQRRDVRLTQRLTFHHKRKSMGGRGTIIDEAMS